jgi:hypothetical protein
VSAALAAAGVLVVAGDIYLCVACWKRESVLGGVLGAASAAAVLFGMAGGAGRHVAHYSLAGAVALVIGTALYGIGHVLERLLEDEAESENRS